MMQWLKDLAPDALPEFLALSGAALIIVGTAIFSVPAALILGGIALLLIARTV